MFEISSKPEFANAAIDGEDGGEKTELLKARRHPREWPRSKADKLNPRMEPSYGTGPL